MSRKRVLSLERSHALLEQHFGEVEAPKGNGHKDIPAVLSSVKLKAVGDEELESKKEEGFELANKVLEAKDPNVGEEQKAPSVHESQEQKEDVLNEKSVQLEVDGSTEVQPGLEELPREEAEVSTEVQASAESEASAEVQASAESEANSEVEVSTEKQAPTEATTNSSPALHVDFDAKKSDNVPAHAAQDDDVVKPIAPVESIAPLDAPEVKADDFASVSANVGFSEDGAKRSRRTFAIANESLFHKLKVESALTGRSQGDIIEELLNRRYRNVSFELLVAKHARR